MNPYRVIARVKNNRLWSAIRGAFPDVRTQRDAAARLKMAPTDLGDWLNMKSVPIVKERAGGAALARSDGLWTGTALRVAAELGETPEYLFDPALYGRGPVVADVAIGLRQLADAGLLALCASPEAEFLDKEKAEVVDDVLSTLTRREERVLRLRFGLDDGLAHTRDEIGDAMGVTGTRIAQIEHRSLRKLRHPSRSRRLREVAGP